ncbi:polysaccharide biosynthesis protein [Psychrobacter cryohalolentis]|uniref:Polysaccharide biosynthesis protein CapD n=1 Tax=Psychrobacter cryohalolentis (strain ATCC BAA-1226 / DSM 17306 / VKM B-2378 / K5) TaxID=335284 RepID=Q1QD58_PSYCK|nr:nucleoside-diphosphate sugar epimerase/dehydratase [Psychrobacter cryohalolentis]ABE74395.1 polysaccharide biosynthesis protein CapD [Psychrobacter cryohalolentis K5]ASE27024.1 polysaccharide biosynthesis protein [Psychrobacter cryohalolentis]
MPIDTSIISKKDKTSPIESNDFAERTAKILLNLPRGIKRSILMMADFIMSVVCLFFAVAARYGYIDNHVSLLLLSVSALIPVLCLYVIGFYNGVARGFFDAMMGSVLQLFFVLIIVAQTVLYFKLLPGIPRAVPILYLFLFFIWLWNSRLTIRELLARWQGQRPQYKYDDYDNVVIYGAGEAGKELLEGLRNSHKYNVVAYVDDDPQLTGAYLLGKQIHAASDLIGLVGKLDIAQVFLAIPSISRSRKRQIIDKLEGISIKIKELPSLEEIAEEKVTVSSMRRVDILDVLDRQTVEPDVNLLQQNITGKSVLVTGAGGSIGSELCRQIIKNKPKCLVLYELSEYALYTIDQELTAKKAKNKDDHAIEIVAIIGNVTNEDNLLRILNLYQIQTVYHAAAYKHVPIVEHNPFEGVINNSKGTYHCARAAIQAKVDTFVLISTDKAVRPTNIMGASKRLAELVCQGLSMTTAHTCISMVRFGNVLGSSGSVVPVFTKQIEQGRPITVTHPDVTRYFMTIPEAANLVIQAGAMAKGGEVFVLDMGEPVKIVDLARRMIHLSGHRAKTNDNPNGDIEIIFTGLRPGEKLYEELIIGEDNIENTHHPLIMQAIEHSFPLDELESLLAELTEKQKEFDVAWLKQQFKQFVDGYRQGS